MFFRTPPLVPRSSPYFKGTVVKVVYYSYLKYLIAHNPPLKIRGVPPIGGEELCLNNQLIIFSP